MTGLSPGARRRSSPHGDERLPAVDDDTFDAILSRVRAAGLEYSADPTHQRPGELNDNDGGRGFYVHDPDGHNLEFLTRPITGSAAEAAVGDAP